VPLRGEGGEIIVDLFLQQNKIYEAGTSIKNDGRMAHRKMEGGPDAEK
jgi:hypothetical protein